MVGCDLMPAVIIESGSFVCTGIKESGRDCLYLFEVLTEDSKFNFNLRDNCNLYSIGDPLFIKKVY